MGWQGEGGSMELKEELILYKKEVVEQHEKGFQKAVR